MELNGTHQLLVDKLGEYVNTINKITALLEATTEAGLEVNAGERKYIVMSRYQNVRQFHKLKRANKSFENVAKFKC